jgi:hypothetical protein
MKTMKQTILLTTSATIATLLVGATLIACSGDDNNAPAPTDAGHPDATATDGGDSGSDADSGNDTGTDASDSGDADAATDSGDGGGIPPVPVLGVQIDRFGRPAVNTALNHAFDPDGSAAGAAKDLYNADTDAGAWATTYTPEIEKNLGILDSLDTTPDANGCGNQPFANDSSDAGPARYATLAGVLANDMMWVNTAATTCSQYLGVELLATGMLPNDGGAEGGPTNECGGRKLPYDVIQTTYSIVSGVGLSGFGSGVNAVASKVNGTTFPYLATPQ